MEITLNKKSLVALLFYVFQIKCFQMFQSRTSENLLWCVLRTSKNHFKNSKRVRLKIIYVFVCQDPVILSERK